MGSGCNKWLVVDRPYREEKEAGGRHLKFILSHVIQLGLLFHQIYSYYSNVSCPINKWKNISICFFFVQSHGLVRGTSAYAEGRSIMNVACP